MKNEHQSENVSWFSSRRCVVLIVFLAIIGFFLFTEHRAHLFVILAYLLLLVCPFMHFFMHGVTASTETEVKVITEVKRVDVVTHHASI